MKLKPLYVKLTADERKTLDRIVAQSGARAERPVSVSEVVRAMIAVAAKTGVKV